MRAVANGPAPSFLPWIKLRPHVTVAAANGALEPIVREMMHSGVSAWHLGLQPIIVPYEQDLGRTLALLLAGVVLLLIIGCANCSILLLARGRARQPELAIRTAIGERLFSILFGIFSAMALALALVGIFSVVAYSVLWAAARIALVSTVAGMVIGVAVDSFLGAVLAHWMQSAFAAGNLFAAAALLAISALLACLLPARHAIAVPPAEALRNE